MGSLADCALNVTTSFVVPEKRAAVRFTTYQRSTFFLRVQAITTITRNTNKGNKPTSKAMSAMTKAGRFEEMRQLTFRHPQGLTRT